MPVKTISRYEATDGTLFENERDAVKYQDSINNVDRVSFRQRTFDKFIETQKSSEEEDISLLYNRLVKGDIDFDESQSFFQRIWLGEKTNIKLNQQSDYTTLLDTILGNDETHIKADGIYDFTINGGARLLMLRSIKVPYNLTVTSGEETYRLVASPGGQFTLSYGKGTIGASAFVDNQWSLKSPEGTFSITWQAGK